MPKMKAYENQANTIIKNMEKRNFKGYYVATAAEAKKKVLSLIADGATIAWGGSMTMQEIGIFEALEKGNYNLIDRMKASSPEEAREIYAKSTLADVYLMSTNAITLEGELINIDGHGNRVACLITGPKKVIIVAGMNKVCSDVKSGYQRVKDVASPPNTVRLNRKTPCAVTGKCEDCYSPDCICAHTVISRRCKEPDRIHVILVGEELGY